jgi:Fe-S cluster assembly scaffold protein SufB
VTDAPRGGTPTTANPPLPAPAEGVPPASRTRARQTAPRRSPTHLELPFANADTVENLSGSLRDPRWLLEDRQTAFAAYERLPIESNALYTPYVDLRNAELDDVSLALPLLSAAIEPSRVPPEIPDGVAAIIEIDQGGVFGATFGDEARAVGLILETFEEWFERDPDGARAAIADPEALPAEDKLAQLTRAFWSIGVHVSLPAGARLEQPVVVRWQLGEVVALLTRTIVDVADDAELKVLEELVAAPYGGGRAPGLLTGTTEARLGRGANLSFASLQQLSQTQVAFQHRTASIGDAANLHWALAQLGTRLVRSRVDNRLVGNGGSVEQVEIVFGSGDQLFDLTSYTRHLGKDATSNLLSKAALQDAARTFLKGLVTIEKSGSGTDSFLGEYGMNLSKKARAVAIPSLEIDQPDCRRVAHSSAVGPIDETQLFYLESRGIPPDEARKFIVLGFLEPVVARVPLESARDRLREALEAKWDAAHGTDGGSSAAA